MTDGVKKTSGAAILLTWLLVCVPLGWGVYRSALNVAKLFQTPAATATH